MLLRHWGVVRTGQLESKKGDAVIKPVSEILCAWTYNCQRELQCLNIFLRVGFYISLDIQTIVSPVGFLFPYLCVLNRVNSSRKGPQNVSRLRSVQAIQDFILFKP